MDNKIFSVLLLLALFLIVVWSIHFDKQQIDSHDTIYMNKNNYVCRDGELFIKRPLISLKLASSRYKRVENASKLPLICKWNKIYKKGE